ncbi:3-ketoacyl-ACP reductase [Mucilaginibacter myungsuensis]|uniref:3-ketoacyl-ACP reductase n=1 Tax=Mucilaginibacter myungsuensis TaxID=649104 RepID=A0A929PZ19_9SPHI|nr:3-ketoacyl-ACP reductase [Mucilaginibacter myungsuensis]MBE9663937.1 3-ketoacyl-ACP reductase [Mucilaginibacter myungsuensis]MDN3598347.1 3-ketoacyl-ACP reductase [Mucilaginibacter myungsuensis]
MQTLKGKKVIVTGGGRGLGKAVALLLAADGADVAITGRNEEHLKTVTSEIEALGVNAAYAVFNVDDEAAVKTNIDKLVAQLGGLDILINNAGIGNMGSLTDMSSADWKQVIQTNLFGAYHVAMAAYPHLLQNGQGDVVNVSSSAGLKGGAGMSAYAASKSALISLSQSMMAEWRKQNIRVITLTPSTIASDMSITAGLTNGDPEKVLQPEDFAEWVRDILKMNRRALIANGSIFSTNP